MNLSQLSARKGQRLRLRPPAEVWNATGAWGSVDDNWLLKEVTSTAVRLTNERTGLPVSLAHDHVHHYSSSPPGDVSFDGFLELSVRIRISGKEVQVEPIPSGVARTIQQSTAPPVFVRVNELMNRINPEIPGAVAGGKFSVGVTMAPHNLRALMELSREPGFNEILRMQITNAVIIGFGNRIDRSIDDLDRSDRSRSLVLLHFLSPGG